MLTKQKTLLERATWEGRRGVRGSRRIALPHGLQSWVLQY